MAVAVLRSSQWGAWRRRVWRPRVGTAVWRWTCGEWEGEADLRGVTAGGQEQTMVGPVTSGVLPGPCVL